MENDASRIRTNQSANITTTMEQNRRSQAMEDYQGPKHADTMPSPTTAVNAQSSVLKGVPGYNRESNEKSEDSVAATTDTKVDPMGTEGEKGTPATSKPRRRKMHLPFTHEKSDETTSPEITSKKPRLFKRSKERKFTAMSQVRATLFNSYINILLIFVPIGIAVNYAGIPKVGVFIINFIAIIPLAAMLSYATEEIALRTGETIGGLLNATFG